VPLRRLARHAREAWEVPRDLLLRRYPPFVTGGPLPRGDVPVFVFHSLEPESFGAKLRYLADNGYVTLSADAYFRLLVGVGPVPERAVVLTFDDGRGTVWSVGFPQMRRYGMRGIVFLVPGRVSEGMPGPTLDDSKSRAPDEILAREKGKGAFLSWGEVEAMASSGLFDFQSHSLSHARIHVGPRLAGFVTPGARRGYEAFDLPLIHADGRDLLGPDVPLGTPLFASDSRLSDALRFFEEPSLRRACVDAVRGDESFFEAPGWEARLRALMAGKEVTGRRESPAERDASIERELRESKRAIEARLGKPVSHLCYPWHVAGASARRLAREAGYRTAFCGKVRGVPISRPGSDPLQIARLGEDYLELLPGRGREELSVVLQRKWRRRLRGRP
jgi:peptidoglycan/xylan/chitin deacetylase (PgdA/CDA1 family)